MVWRDVWFADCAAAVCDFSFFGSKSSIYAYAFVGREIVSYPRTRVYRMSAFPLRLLNLRLD